MPLPEELEVNGCIVRGGPMCPYVASKVEYCVDCKFYPLSIEEIKNIAGEYLIEEGHLDEYPIVVELNEGECALCRQEPNAATTKVYSALAHQSFDVNRDFSGPINGSDTVIEIPCCDQCKGNLKKLRRMHTLYGFIGVAVMLLINFGANILLLRDGGNTFTLLAALLVSMAVGYGIYSFGTNRLRRKIARQTIMHMDDIPSMMPLLLKGWYVMGREKFKSDFTEKPKQFSDQRNMKRVQRQLKRLNRT
ncbi:hypothetical protein LJC55_01605 [Eubacteriales bacterium OttesenSCG-928-N14]|nr:hypothetical protein [Eubacteriales bacterium OttesenSCG-928-N14]